MGSGGPGGGGGMSDLFDILSGGGGRRASARQERRGESVVHRLKVTLDEMYNGATRCVPCPPACTAGLWAVAGGYCLSRPAVTAAARSALQGSSCSRLDASLPDLPRPAHCRVLLVGTPQLHRAAAQG